jgi:hypothetical protein
MVQSRRALIVGDAAPIVDLLERFFQERPVRSVVDSNEAALQAIIEAFWHEGCISELCLVVDPNKDPGRGRFGFVDLFLAPPTGSSASHIPVVELKNVTLKGILRARGNTEATRPNLLQKDFCYWDSNSGKYRQQSIQNLVGAAVKQLNKYLRVVKKGDTVSSRAGILDRRVRCRIGMDQLDGYVLVCIGGTRVVVQKAGTEMTQHSFQARHIR